MDGKGRLSLLTRSAHEPHCAGLKLWLLRQDVWTRELREPSSKPCVACCRRSVERRQQQQQRPASRRSATAGAGELGAAAATTTSAGPSDCSRGSHAPAVPLTQLMTARLMSSSDILRRSLYRHVSNQGCGAAAVGGCADSTVRNHAV